MHQREQDWAHQLKIYALEQSQSIGYEIVTRLGPRVPRIYLNEI